MKGTIKEITEALNKKQGSNLQDIHINGFLKTMVALGKAKEVGKTERPKSFKGRSAAIFEVEV